jgi:hypothetical protein
VEEHGTVHADAPLPSPLVAVGYRRDGRPIYLMFDASLEYESNRQGDEGTLRPEL